MANNSNTEKVRFIHPKIVQSFVEQEALYQESEHGNIVFVGTDNKGNPKSASEKSTISSGSGFKMTVFGSNCNYGFCWRGSGKRLFVFEAAIDLMSFITLNSDDWQNNSYISLDGLSSKPLIRFLEESSEIKEINICLDYDSAGIENAEKIRDMLLEKGYAPEQINRLYPAYKDWNEQLKSENGISPIPAKTHPKKDAYRNIVRMLMKVNKDIENPYVQWRNKNFEQNGINFYLTQIKKEIDMIEGCIKSNGNNIKPIESGVLRISDLGIRLMCAAGDNKSYDDIAYSLKKEYKVYKDKERMPRRIDDLKKEISCLSNIKTDGSSLFLLAKDIAETAIKTEIYIKTDYALDMERKAYFKENLENEKLKNEMTDIEGDEGQCQTLS